MSTVTKANIAQNSNNTTVAAGSGTQANQRLQNITKHIATDLTFGTEECTQALLRAFPNLNILDQSVWEKCVDMETYGLDFSDLEPLTYSYISKILSAVDFSQIDGDAGVTIGFLPKNLTFDKIRQFSASPKQGDAVKVDSWFMERLSHDFGKITLNTSTLAVLTNNTITGTREHPGAEAQEGRLKYTRWHKPQLMAVAAFAVVSYMNSKANFYNSFLESNTRCVETVNGKDIVVGRAPATGSDVNIHAAVGGNHPTMGVGGMRLYQDQ